MQKESFGLAKGLLLGGKRTPFAHQMESFSNVTKIDVFWRITKKHINNLSLYYILVAVLYYMLYYIIRCSRT